MQAPTKIVAVNGSDREWTTKRYVLSFGAYGSTNLLIWADHLQEAFDVAVDWIVDNAPGLLADDQVAEAYQEALKEGKSESEAYEIAYQDVSVGGNCGNCVLSYEWAVTLSEPTREQLLQIQGRA